MRWMGLPLNSGVEHRYTPRHIVIWFKVFERQRAWQDLYILYSKTDLFWFKQTE